MSRDMVHEKPNITSDMTILDVVSKYRDTEAVFRRYDEKGGECLCCQALFDPLKEVAERYGIDLDRLMAELEAAAGDS